ncbi:hypothetical protein HQQ94_04460 [Shewanella sp. VB17]|uniref:hypothetical protein n=1 Tax=Shewanella sp. VB17 TaxID=2739432 RepID=UPI00156372F3|nr:hypothetical protein [Shewanella sp. VB17]NRD72510.1 hypothetical protein [Shewanella sp. VB17]
MKKILIAAAVVAAGAGAYWANQQGETANSDSHSILASVPADTPFFVGQLTPFPINAYINSISDGYQTYNDDMFTELNNSDDARSKFMLSLAKTYMKSMKSGDEFVASFGLPDKVHSYFYTLGMLPVIKLEVEKPEAIWSVLDKAEKESGFTHDKRSVKGRDYRAYKLTDKDEDVSVALIFAIADGILTVTFDTSFNEPSTLETALGLLPVSHSLADAGIVEDIIKTHGFSGDSIGYINHQELIKAITTKDGNQLARQLTAFAEQEGEDPFAMVRSEQCHTELSAIATNWPRTVFGANNGSISETQSKINMTSIIESKNQVMLDALSSMRGFIPDYIRNGSDSVFSMGLGIELNQFVPALTSIWDEMSAPKYQCQVLQQVQESMSGQSPAMLGMFTGMANGVKGLAVSLIDYQFSDDKDNPALKSVDALISLSADNPSSLFNMVKPFVPELADVKLNDNGDAIDLSYLLPVPAEYGIKPQMAIKGHHLVVFTGDAGEAKANELANEALSHNGIYSLSANYGKMVSPLIALAEMAGEQVPEELSMMANDDMQMTMGIDVNPNGIVFDSSFDSKIVPSGQ